MLWAGDEILNKSNLVINKLKAIGKKVFFVTNNSTKSREQYVEKCSKLGFNVTKDEIVGSSFVLASYLQQRGFQKKVYIVGSEGVGKELDHVGIKHIGIGPDPMVGSPMDLVQSVQLDPEVGAVVVGFDGHISLPKILKAASYINSVPDCLFLATNTDECLPVIGTSLTYPGTGCMVQAVETVVGRQAEVMGKPQPRMFEVIRAQHDLQPERTVMVGDRCNTDILLGANCGLQTMMVLTGVHKLEDVQQWADSKDPDLLRQIANYYLPSLGDLLELME